MFFLTCRLIKNFHCNAVNKLYINIFQWFRNVFTFNTHHPLYVSWYKKVVKLNLFPM